MTFCPQYYKVVSGVGKSQYPLVAFDNALRDAGIGDFNIIQSKQYSACTMYVFRENKFGEW